MVNKLLGLTKRLFDFLRILSQPLFLLMRVVIVSVSYSFLYEHGAKINNVLLFVGWFYILYPILSYLFNEFYWMQINKGDKK